MCDECNCCERIAELESAVEELTSQQETVDELEAIVEEQAQKIEDQQETIDEQAQEIDELHAEKEQLQERVAELEGRPTLEYRDPEQAEPSDLVVDDYPLGAKVTNSMTELDVEEMLDERDLEQTDAETEAVDELQAAADEDLDLLPIQELVRLPESMAQRELEANDLRARFIWQDFEEYSERTPTGRVIHATTIRRVLQAAEPIVDGADEATRIEAKTVGRVMDCLVDHTRGAAEITKRDGQRRLHVPNDWRDAADDSADSAVSRGTS
jgi:uncharacterized coiled-coil protein SlyX